MNHRLGCCQQFVSFAIRRSREAPPSPRHADGGGTESPPWEGLRDELANTLSVLLRFSSLTPAPRKFTGLPSPPLGRRTRPKATWAQIEDDGGL